MLWLHEQGNQFIGIELSQKAIEHFFSAIDLPLERSTEGPFTVFTGTGKAGGIKLLAGDFLALAAPSCSSPIASAR